MPRIGTFYLETMVMSEEYIESYLEEQDRIAEQWDKEEKKREAKLAEQQYKEYFEEAE